MMNVVLDSPGRLAHKSSESKLILSLHLDVGWTLDSDVFPDDDDNLIWEPSAGSEFLMNHLIGKKSIFFVKIFPKGKRYASFLRVKNSTAHKKLKMSWI